MAGDQSTLASNHEKDISTINEILNKISIKVGGDNRTGVEA